MGRIARTLFLTFLFLFASLAALAQASSSRQRLDKSAGWGVDRDTGNIVVDASLIVLYDPLNQTVVVNPNYLQDALAETGAQEQRDGSWLFPDGRVIRPLVGRAAIVLGDEPAGLVEASGLPAVAYEKVNLVDRVGLAAADPSAARSEGASILLPTTEKPAGGNAMKLRHSHRCTGCLPGCPFTGCNGGNELLSPLVSGFSSCSFALFHRCREEYKPSCQVDYTQCVNCAGAIFATSFLYSWQCGSC